MSPNEQRVRMDWRAFTPADSPKTPADLMSDPLHRDLATAKLEVDDPAFDFELDVYDFSRGAKRSAARTFSLREASDQRPVALIFGSYT